MDSVYYQTLLLSDGRFSDLSASKETRNQFDNALREYGKEGWRAYHVTETDAGLLVFLQRVDRAGDDV
jgi:hypothetical protein